MSGDLPPVQPGFELPPLRSEPITLRQLRDYACASGDFNRLHLSPDFAREAGHPSPPAHGMLTMALMGRLLTGWAGAGSVRKLDVRFLDVTYDGERVLCEGRVTACNDETATLEVWATRSDGKKTAAGTAELVLPKR